MKNYLATILIAVLFSLQSFAHQTSPGSNKSTGVVITVMPNPVKNNMVIFKLEGLKNKTYAVKILSDKGTVAASEKFNSPTGTTFRMIQLSQKFKGYGRVQLLEEGGKVVAQSQFLVMNN